MSKTGASTRPSDKNIKISDVTTNNASTSVHGFIKKLDNNSAHFMDGTGAWSTPAGGGSSTTSILAYAAKTANYTITATDYFIDCTSGTFTITLLTAVGITGQRFVVKNSGTGIITIATTSSQTIDGYASAGLNLAPKQSYTFISDNANWKIEPNSKIPVVLISGTASAAATIDIDLSSYYNIYDSFKISLYHLYPATDNVDIWLRVSADGTTYDAGASNYSWGENYVYDTGGTGGGGNTGDTKGVLSAGNGNTQANAGSCFIELQGLSNSAYKPMILTFSFFAKYAGFGGNTVSNRVGIKRLAAQVTKGVRILASSGNINAEYIVTGCLK